jgi:RND superfamily putative drug exporter
MFHRWGRFVYRRRHATLALSVALLGVSIYGVLQSNELSSGNSATSSIEAARANDLITKQLVPARKQTGSGFTLIFGSKTLRVDDPAFRSALEQALEPLKTDPRVTDVTTPYTAPGATASSLVSKDSHKALVQVRLKDASSQAQKYYAEVRSEVRSSTLSVEGTGTVPIQRAFNTTLESDLQRAEYVSLPITLLLLLLIFGTVVAAGMPLGVGVLSIVGGIAATFLLSRFTDVSQYALNIVTLIGLAVAIDYSLFVVNRFRDELSAGRSKEDAVAVAMATAGRAITFSGLTVAIGLSAMLFFQGTFLASMGAAGAMVVGIAVFYGLTFLPALLAVAGGGVNRLRLPFTRPHRHDSRGFWHSIAHAVMRRPLLALAPTLAFLVVAGIPFLSIRLANGDVDMLPPQLEARQGYDTLVRDFPGQDQTTIVAVVYYPGASPLTSDHVGALYDLSRRLAALPNVLRVESVVNLDPKLTKADYQRLYSSSPTALPASMQQALQVGAGRNLVLVSVVTNKTPESDQARAIVKQIRAESVGGGGQILVTGQTAYDLDIVGSIVQKTPIAVGFVILVTYLVLFLLTGSVVLPLKAVIVNLLSISASFGALVWIFQQGHLSGLLNFTPQSIDPTIPVILFSLVFGMSMDYEVLLVSRIQEEYRRTGDNRLAVAEGLQRSGRLISGAAAIMVAVFLAFALAQVLLIKSIGLGLAIAVAIDATLVRMLLVPAVMRLLGDLNWWAPRPLAWLHSVAGLSVEGWVPAESG